MTDYVRETREGAARLAGTTIVLGGIALVLLASFVLLLLGWLAIGALLSALGA